MATSPQQFEALSSLLLQAEDIAFRPMMGESLMYCRGVLIGGIYDGRVLLKECPAALARLPEAHFEEPYPGARPMLRLECFDAALLQELFPAMVAELPPPKSRKAK